MINLSEQAKKSPRGPGVYLFRDPKRRVLYIGRASSLRRRVLSYFQKKKDLRIEEMINKSSGIKYFKTANLLEAIILESNLIKKYWPKYNIRERDDRSFAYVIIPKRSFSRPMIIRGHELNKVHPLNAYIFGPYKSISLIEAALKIIRRLFPYPNCLKEEDLLSNNIKWGRPCLDYQIGLCPAPCLGYISEKEYRKNMNNLILFLKGDKVKLLRRLKKENPDKAEALKHIQDVSLLKKEDDILSSVNRIEGYDVSHFSGKNTYGAMVVFENNLANKSSYRLFKIKGSYSKGDDLAALEEVLSRRLRHPEWRLPDLMLIDGGKPQVERISSLFRRNNVTIPLVGISKYQNDKLVFPKKTNISLKELISSLKEVLLRVRDESHRFAIYSSRRGISRF